MSRLVALLLTMVIALYPALVYFGANHLSARVLGAVLLVSLLLRFVYTSRAGKSNPFQRILPVLCLFALVLILIDSQSMLLWYPVLISGLMLGLFGYSLLFPPSLIEYIARISEPDLPPEAIAYTRKVTLVWCGFFVFNGTVAAVTILWANFELWTLYNGLISYLLMGLLFAGEMLVRRKVRRG